MSCKFCTPPPDQPMDICYFEYGGLVWKSLAPEFCPMCGAPLSEPKPLTLDELREMDGEPVWCKEDGRLGIVLKNDDEYEYPMFRVMFNDGTSLTEYYIKTRAPKGMFYRRKPREG